MGGLDRFRLSINAGIEGEVTLKVLHNTGVAVAATVVLDGEDATVLAAKLVLMAAVSGAHEGSVADQITGRLLGILDGLQAVPLIEEQAEELLDLTPTSLALTPTTIAVEAAPVEVSAEPDGVDPWPARCAECGVELGTRERTLEHGRVGCKTHDTGDVRCADCGRGFVNATGLGVHRARAHPSSYPGGVTSTPRPSPVWVWDAARPAPEPHHRLAEERRVGDEHHAICECGEVGRGATSVLARLDLRDHVPGAEEAADG